MTNILLVLSGPRGEASHSSRVARAIVERLRAANPEAAVTLRDLGQNPLPHIDKEFVAGLGTAAEARTPTQAAAIATSDSVVREVMEADVVVIASAMINFGVSSTLKSWFDHLLRSGITFSYTAEGPVGLVSGKKVYLAEARGGVYSSEEYRHADFQEPYIRHTLGFIGITDLEVIAVEGVALGPEVEQRALAGAMAQVEQLAA